MESFTKAWGGSVDVLSLNFSLQICCILLQVMATNVMGPALLTKACFFFDGLKI